MLSETGRRGGQRCAVGTRAAQAAELAETAHAGFMQDMPVLLVLWCFYMQAATAQVVRCKAQLGTVLPAARAMHLEGFHCNLLSPLNHEPAAEQVGCLTLGIRQHLLVEVLVINPLQAAGSPSGCPLSRGGKAKANLKHNG